MDVDRGRLDQGVDIGIAGFGSPWNNFGTAKLIERFLLSNLAEYAYARAQCLPVILGLEKVLVNTNWFGRIGGSELQPTTTLRTQGNNPATPAIRERPLEWPIRLGRYRRCGHHHLQVGQPDVRIALDEADQADREVVRKTGPETIGLGAFVQQAVVAKHSRKRPLLLAREHNQDRQMVLQIL